MYTYVCIGSDFTDFLMSALISPTFSCMSGLISPRFSYIGYDFKGAEGKEKDARNACGEVGMIETLEDLKMVGMDLVLT